MASALAAEIRKGSDCLARYGGEEFVVLWCNLDLSQAAAMAERLRRRIAELALPHAGHGSGSDVSLSIGVAAQRIDSQASTASADEIEHQIDALLRQADDHLYTAKAAGRNRVVSH